MSLRQKGIVLADSVTKLGPDSTGAVIVAGSHGGVYPGYLVGKAGGRAVILNDAGVGKNEAGIGSLSYCEKLGVAAATVSHNSARIGDAVDMMERGVISQTNRLACEAGCVPGMDCAEAARLLTTASLSGVQPEPYQEARVVVFNEPGWPRVICLDSASLVKPEDAGQIVITGSHGGLLGSNKAMALQVDAFVALFNDAGVGADGAGITRLPALDERGIAAATVAAASARIGDGQSTYRDGALSHVNRAAVGLDARIGMQARDFVDRILQRSAAH